MTTEGKTTKLVQELHDEFLVCRICMEPYKNPKCLNCMHSFCARCIEGQIMAEATYKKYCEYREFTCPLCRRRTQLPLGGVRRLADNFIVSSLSEIVARQRPSSVPLCDLCKQLSNRERDAESKCLDCNKQLCMGCTSQHRQTRVTSAHCIIDIDVQKDIECKEHKEEVVKFYCEPCQQCICVLCTFNEHKDHDISQFGEAVDKYRAELHDIVDSCNAKVNHYDSASHQMEGAEERYRATEQLIHDTAMNYIQEVRVRERQLVEELRNVYGPDMISYIENRKEIGFQVDSLRTTCKLTEQILLGKTVELLLLKQDIKDKLLTLGAIEFKDVPRNADRVIQYRPGHLDMGSIFDPERPLMSSLHGGCSSMVNKKLQNNVMMNNQSMTNHAMTNQSMTNQSMTNHAMTNHVMNHQMNHYEEQGNRLNQNPVIQTMNNSTQTDNFSVTMLPKGVQTDSPQETPPSTPSPRLRHAFFNRRGNESSAFSKPARFG